LGLTDDQSTLIFLVGDPKTGRTLYATAIADGGARSVAEGASAVLSAGGSRIVFYTNGNDVAWVDLTGGLTPRALASGVGSFDIGTAQSIVVLEYDAPTTVRGIYALPLP